MTDLDLGTTATAEKGVGRSSEPEDDGEASLARRGGLFALRHVFMVAIYAVLAFLVIVPLGVLLYATFVDTPPRPGADAGSFTLQNYTALLNPPSLDALGNSLRVGIGATILAVVVGTFLAWVATRTDVPGKRLIQVTAVAPLFVSPLVGAIAWSMLASPRAGYLNVLFRDLGLDFVFNVHSVVGMVLVFTLYYTPYVFLFVAGALNMMNPELEEAAEVHGGRLRQVLGNVTLRIVTPAILGSAVLVLMLIMENFSVPTIIGSPAGEHTLSSRIYRLMASAPSKPNEAAATGMALFAMTFALVYIQRRVISAREYTTVTGKGLKPRLAKLGRLRWPALGLVGIYALLAVVMPFFALGQAAFRQVSFVPDTMALFDFSVFGLDHFRNVIGLDAFQRGVKNSLVLGAVTATLGGAFYFTLAYVVYRTQRPGRRYIEYLAMWPLAVPALVMGMGYLWTWINLPTAIYGTLFMIGLAFLGRFMPQGFRATASTIGQVHKELEESAMMSGASRFTAVRRITMPLARSGIVAAMLLLFVLSMRELSTAIFLFTSRSTLLSIVVFNQWETGGFAGVAAISLLYTGLLLLVTIIGQRWFGFKAVDAP